MVECQKLKPMLLRHQLLQQIISVAELFDQILQANSYFSCFCTSFLFISQHQTETGHLKNTPSANRTWAFGLALALAGAFTTGFVGACGAWTDAENASGVRGSKWATDAVTDNLNPPGRVDLVSMIWFPFYGDFNSNASRDLRQKLKRLSSWWLNAATCKHFEISGTQTASLESTLAKQCSKPWVALAKQRSLLIMSNSLCAALSIRAHQPNRGKPTAPQKPTHKPIWLEYGSSVRCKQPSRSCKMVDALVCFISLNLSTLNL